MFHEVVDDGGMGAADDSAGGDEGDSEVTAAVLLASFGTRG
jgi:hypothetical protein